MYISKNWLSDFVSLPKKLTAQELMEKMTLSSVEVESVRDLAKDLEGVIVAEILEVSPHADADRLQVAIVNDGKNKLNIVCGAPNIAAGQKVPLAKVGTYLPAMGMTIEKRKVRGEVSEGMICAPDELGLGEDHAGILILEESVPVGKDLADVLSLNDWILEVDNKSMTHRPDMWGHYGMAREVAAFLKTDFKEYEPAKIKIEGKEKLSVKVKDGAACPRYMGLVVDGIEVGPSPDWLKSRLASIGQQSVNNVVDVTNYVMFEFGQPMHAFDYDSVDGAEIIVRRAKKDEGVTTLDDKELKLSADDLVIADKKRVLAIAGIKGAKNSGVSEKTKKIILESANFDHITIRTTSTKLGLRTEASARYEKSLDPNLAELCLRRAVELLLKVCPNARAVSAIEDESDFKLDLGPIETSVEYIQDRIGMEVSEKEIVSILESLGFEVSSKKGELKITIPTWRATKDVTGAHDIVEEIARMYGFDNIISKLPTVVLHRPPKNRLRTVGEKTRDLLAYGFDMAEVYTYPFIGEEAASRIGEDPKDFVRVANPQAQGLELLRRSLIPGILNEVALNARFFDHFNLFEVGVVFAKNLPGEFVDDKQKKRLPQQNTHVAGTVYDKGAEAPYYTAKNIVEQLLHRLHIPYEIIEAKETASWTHKERTMLVRVGGAVVGHIGEVAPELKKKLHLDERVGFFELDLTILSEHYSDEIRYRPIPKYPAIAMDISMIVDKTLLWSQVENLVTQSDKELVRAVELFDVYEGEGIPETKKSLAFRITYRSDDKTLSTREAEDMHNKIKENLRTQLKADTRD